MKTYNTIVKSREVKTLENVVARAPYECVKLDENKYGFMDNERGDIRNYFCDTLGYECSNYEAFDFEYFDEPIKLDPEIYLFASKIASSLNKRITFTYNKKQKRIEYVIMRPNDENIQLGFDFHETNRKELIFMADIYVKSENRWFIITKNIDNTYTLQENTEGDDIKYIKDYESNLDTCISSLLKEISTKNSSTKEPQSVEPNKPNFYTQNGWEGSKYDYKKGAKEVAKELRSYIKTNPDLNACKWSITSKWGMYADSLYISLMAAPFDPFSDEFKKSREYEYRKGYAQNADYEGWTTEPAQKVIEKVKAFVMQYIHYDSDGMIDYFDRNIYDHYDIGKFDKPFQIIEKKESKRQSGPAGEPNEGKAAEPVAVPEGLEIVDYSEKAIAVFGDTKAIKEELKKLRGKFNPYLNHNGEKRSGWIFSKKQADKVRALLAPASDPSESVTLPEPPKEIDITDVLDEVETKQEESEPVKLYNTSFGIGTAKYVVNFHDGIKRHKDGSRFYDIRIFSNKKEMGKFIKELEKDGYKLDTFFSEPATVVKQEPDRIAFAKASKEFIQQWRANNPYPGSDYLDEFNAKFNREYSAFVEKWAKDNGTQINSYMFPDPYPIERGEYKETALDRQKKAADILVESIDGNWYTIRLNREIEIKGKRIKRYDNGCIAVPESVYTKLQGKYNVMCNF